MGALNDEMRESAGVSDDEVLDVGESQRAIAGVGGEQASLTSNPRWDEGAAGKPQASSNCDPTRWNPQALEPRPTQPLRMKQRALRLSMVAEHSDLLVDSSTMKMILRVGQSQKESERS